MTTTTSASATTVARSDIIERIGRTPLIELTSFSTKHVKLYAKLEWFNPFGSVKDRAAYWMIKDAEKRGILKKGKSIIIEPTSGNTGSGQNKPLTSIVLVSGDLLLVLVVILINRIKLQKHNIKCL